MSKGNQELELLTNEVIEFIKLKLMRMNQQDILDDYLVQIEFKEKAIVNSGIDRRTSKILIIGQIDIKEEAIKAIFKDCGISKDRLELVREYDKAKKYNFSKLQWSRHYGVILFGPIPHSAEGKKDSSSIITEIEKNECYPPSKRLSANNAIKVTKTNLRQAVEELIADGVIYQDL